jgi:hypothetical protein
MKTISLYNILEKQNHSYADSGSIVFDIAKNAIQKREIVIIDMDGVDSVPTNFMNTSFGALINIFGIENTKKSFKFRNILKSQIDRISKYFNDYQTIVNLHS